MVEAEKSACFAGLPRRGLDSLAGARVALIGAADASPYQTGVSSHAADAPAAIRKASSLFAGQEGQIDFDLDATLPKGDDRGIVDCGDVETDPADAAGNRRRITAAARRILEAGAVPIVLGGDDSVPIPVFAAYEGRGPLTMVQVDAHVDWGDVIKGNRYGYGSPMRRASEMPWVTHMVQVGIRGLGSGTPDQIEDAHAWGSRLVTMRQIREAGISAALAQIQSGADCVLSIDCDGLDPSVLPAVNMPTPGGLGYGDLLDLLRGVAAKGRIVGCNLVELVPARDKDGLSALTAARIVLTVAGLVRLGA